MSIKAAPSHRSLRSVMRVGRHISRKSAAGVYEERGVLQKPKIDGALAAGERPANCQQSCGDLLTLLPVCEGVRDEVEEAGVSRHAAYHSIMQAI